LVSGVLYAAASIASLACPVNLLAPYDAIDSAVSSFEMAANDLHFPSAEERVLAVSEARRPISGFLGV